MPVNGFLINLIDNLTLLLVIFTVGILLVKKCWMSRAMTCILVNSVYSIFQFVIVLLFPMESKENEIITNFTMHIDTISGFCFFFYLWNDSSYRKFLVYTLTPVLATWLISFAFTRDLKIPSWNLLLPSLWFFISAIYAMLLLYRKSSFQESASYISRFLLITGFLFYNFIYLIVETCYIFFKSVSNVTDAWNINYWGYFIFRLMILAGVIAWYSRKQDSAVSFARIRK
ncbi:hypothetical protein [Flavihumibacter profundi]|jgi:hypothetical protein|uniref:hypothetical protein n=1 Tax=Flavihumibacter profundi TaxID=2716883 RepID=UPI001CC46DAB|nr:hypothetical protein [Flavihumibacter profundi]MBZ5856441.1 hypothetical protein [Flavihumibacter profundi]